MSENEKQEVDALENEDDESEILSFFKSLITLVIIVVLLRGSVIEAFRIPSESMVPTLIETDHILVTKFSYGLRIPLYPKTLFQYSTPKRNDIVVFTKEDDSSTNIIKRVIGLPGETIEVKNTEVFINGEKINEPKNVTWMDGGLYSYGPVKIPEGHVFLMGDNRDHSRDSRFWDNPFLDIRLIKGRAQIIYFSWASLKRIGNMIR